MLKITSFSALIVGLLIAAPIVFSDAEAGRSDLALAAVKSDRESSDTVNGDRLAAAFKLVDVCSPGAMDSALAQCIQHDAAATGKLAANTTTVESRDEVAQTSTLASGPSDQH